MAKSGAKGDVTVAPLDFRGWPTDRAKRRELFIKTYITTAFDDEGNEIPLSLQPFQAEITKGAFAPGIRTALVSMPRANGKTLYAALLALAELFVGPPEAEVLCVASNASQAGHVLKYAKAIVAKHPELAERVQVFSNKLYVPQNDSTLLPLPADADALHGYNPSLLIVDELHVVTEAVWEACTSVAGKRKSSLTLAISTPADSSDSVMWRLVQHGRRGGDPTFYFKEYAAPANCKLDDREAWRQANPALTCPQPFMFEDGLLSQLHMIREPVFRQLRLGQWVAGIDSWLPWGEWDKRKAEHAIKGPVCLAFDGSASGDSTALVGCTLDGHIWLVGLWEKSGDPSWRVPREEVSNAIDLAFERYDVLELACDPWGWRSEIETWANRYGPTRVIEWNTSYAGRMAPATDRLYQAVMTETVTQDGDPRLAAHVGHCIAKPTPQGDLVHKDKKSSPRKIDAAVAAIVAFDRAAHHKQNPEPAYNAWSFD